MLLLLPIRSRENVYSLSKTPMFIIFLSCFSFSAESHFKEFQSSQAHQEPTVTFASIPSIGGLSRKIHHASFPTGTTTRAFSSAHGSSPKVISTTKSSLSVYDSILPRSIGWCRPSLSSTSSSSSSSPRNNNDSNSNKDDLLPLTQHLKDGFDAGRSLAWHRQDERDARGLSPTVSVDAELEDWERELVWTEILILSGSSDPQTFTYLARAWGRDDGLHGFLSQFVGVPVASTKGGTTTTRPPSRPHPPSTTTTTTTTPSAALTTVVSARPQHQQHHQHDQHHQHYYHPQQQYQYPPGAGMDSWIPGASDPLAAESFDFSGEFFLEDLERDVLSSSSGGEDNEDYEGGRPNDDEETETTLFCQPCRETAV